MPETRFRGEENVRPPLLNGLIIVTLVTVIVALGYLAGYYLGEGNERKPTWFAPQMICHLPAETCTAQLGRFGSMRFTLHEHRNSSAASFEVQLENVEAREVDVVLEGRAKYSGTERISLMPLGAGRFVGEGRRALCTTSIMRWRAKVIAHTLRGQLGSWFDFDLPCSAR